MPVQDLINLILAELRSAWRFRWLGLAAAWVLGLIGLGVVIMMPNVFEAKARVYVDSTSVLRPVVENRLIQPDYATQLNRVRQALLGRVHLTRVIEENGLASGPMDPEYEASLIERLRTGIEIWSEDRTGTGLNTVYNIGFKSSNRVQAIGVVDTLLRSLVDGTLTANEEGTDKAEQFLEDEIAAYEVRLETAEQELAEFQKRNADRLSASDNGYYTRLANARDALEQAEKELRLARGERDSLVEQIESGSPVTIAGSVATEPPPNSLDARIRDTQAELDRLTLDFTDRHPGVERAREQLERLHEQRSEQLRALGVQNPDVEVAALGANPIYQASQIALNEVNVRIARLEAEVEEQASKVEELRAAIDEIPEVEAELTRLNRDYDVIYNEYLSLVRSRETQNLSRRATETDDVEFQIIDQPEAGFKPVSPNRPLFFAAVLIAAIGAGGGLCWLLAQLKPVFDNAVSLRQVTGLPVLGVVGHAWESELRISRRLSLFGFACSVAVLCAVFAVAAGLDVIGVDMSDFVRSVV